MTVQPVGGAGSWTEFVKLVQEARARNQGIGGAVSKTAGLGKPAQFSIPARVQQQYGVMKSSPATVPAAANDLATKIAGSFFDAYA